MNRIKNIDKELLIVLFLLLGPILDVTSFYNLPLNIFIRGLYLVFIIYELLKNKSNLKLLLILIIFSIIQLVFQKYYLSFSIKDSISNVLKFLYLPISLLYFSSFEFKKYEKNKILTIIVFIYVIIFLLSYVTGLGANAYLEKDGKSGFKGVFTSINEFSAILVGLLPIVSIYLKNTNKKLLVLLLIGILFCSLLIGTKVLLGGLLFTLIYLIYINKDDLFFNRNRMQKIIIILCAIIIIVAGLFLVTKTRTYQNMLVQQDFFKTKSVISYDFLNHVVFNDRLSFLDSNIKYFLNSNLLYNLFGIGINTYNVKLVEIDIFDILFRYGLFGLLISLYAYSRLKYKELRQEEKLSLILFILISLTSGHVLFYPNVCIYIGLLASKSKK